MSHVRTQIRSAIVARLTGLSTTGSRVYPSRIYPLADENLPCLAVYLDEEEISTESIGTNAPLDRMADLKIKVCAKSTSSLDATLDGILAEVETAIGTAPDQTFGNLLKMSPLPVGISVDMEDTLEKPVGIAIITYRINYFTAASNPALAI